MRPPKKSEEPGPLGFFAKCRYRRLTSGNPRQRKAALEWFLRGQAGIPESLLMTIAGDEERRRREIIALLSQSYPESLPLLIAGLRSSSETIRQTADAVFTSIENPGVLTTFIEFLSHENRFLVRSAIRHLNRWLREAVQPLMSALSSPSIETRRYAAEILGDIGDISAVPSLLRLLSDTQSGVRDAAAWALGNLGHPAIPFLLKALAKAGGGERKTLLEILIRSEDPRVFPHLESALTGEDRDLRWKAVMALGPSRNRRAIGLLIGSLKDPDSDVRNAAAHGLAGRGMPAVDPLLRALDDPSRYSREEAEKALGAIGVRAAAPLFRALTKVSEEARETLVRIMVCWGPDITPFLMKRLSASSRDIQVVILRLFGRIRDPRCLPTLPDFLKSEDREVRFAAAETLGIFAEESVDLVQDFIRRNDPFAFQEELSLIFHTGFRCWLKPLGDFLTGDNPPMKRIAARTLGQFRDTGALRGLLPLLKDQDPALRETAAWALGEIGRNEAAPALLEALETETEEYIAHTLLWSLKDLKNGLIDSRAREWLSGSRDTLKARALRLLGSRGDDIANLLPCLEDSSDEVALAAAETLAARGARDAAERIALRMKNRPEAVWLRMKTALDILRGSCNGAEEFDEKS